MIDPKYFEDSYKPSMETEGEANGQAFLEVEFQIYGKLTDMTVLEKAAKAEHQEQWSFKIPQTDKNAGSATLRVRSVNRGEQYVRTTKTVSVSGAPIEIESPSSKDEFDAFMIFADQGMIKTRYTFPVDGREFEVDVYYDSTGVAYPYVKIDLEIKELENKILTKEELVEALNGITLPDLPFELEDVIVLPPVNRNPEDNRRVSELYEKYFLTPNYYLQTNQQQENVVDQPGGDVQPSGESIYRDYGPVLDVELPADQPEGATHYVISEAEAVPTGWYQLQGVDAPKMFAVGGDDYLFRLDDYARDAIKVIPTEAQFKIEMEGIAGVDDTTAQILLDQVNPATFQDIYKSVIDDLQERLENAQRQ